MCACFFFVLLRSALLCEIDRRGKGVGDVARQEPGEISTTARRGVCGKHSLAFYSESVLYN